MVALCWVPEKLPRFLRRSSVVVQQKPAEMFFANFGGIDLRGCERSRMSGDGSRQFCRLGGDNLITIYRLAHNYIVYTLRFPNQS